MQREPRRPTFLVADDVQAIAHLVCELLRESGAEVVACATDGVQALRLFHATLPDAVVLDLQMPGLNGLQVLRAIRESEHGRRCLVIVLTSHGEESIREQVLADGADHCLHKSTEFERLLQIVPEFARSHAAARQA